MITALYKWFYLPTYLVCMLTNCWHVARLSLDICKPLKENEWKWTKTRIWADAQRDGRPAEYRWRPLFNAAKFGWCPLLECRAVTLPRREIRWNVLGCPKLANRSQPLVGWSSPYCEVMWGETLLFNKFFFRLSIHALLWPPYGTGQAIIFLPCSFYLLSFFLSFSSPNLSSRRLDVYHNFTHCVALVRI